MPDVVRRLLERHPRLAPVLVEQAHVDGLGALAEQRDVGALAVPGGAERGGAAGPGARGSRRCLRASPSPAAHGAARRRAARPGAGRPARAAAGRGRPPLRARASRARPGRCAAARRTPRAGPAASRAGRCTTSAGSAAGDVAPGRPAAISRSSSPQTNSTGSPRATRARGLRRRGTRVRASRAVSARVSGGAARSGTKVAQHRRGAAASSRGPSSASGADRPAQPGASARPRAARGAPDGVDQRQRADPLGPVGRQLQRHAAAEGVAHHERPAARRSSTSSSRPTRRGVGRQVDAAQRRAVAAAEAGQAGARPGCRRGQPGDAVGVGCGRQAPAVQEQQRVASAGRPP